MNGRSLLRLGLLALLLALVLPVVNRALSLAERDRVDTWADWMLWGAAVLLGLALLLWLLEKVGLRVAGARCEDCGRSVQYGRSLCHDHLIARAHAAQQKHR